MARIELRHATVRILDGYTVANGVINDAGVSNGDVTLTVAGFAVALDAGIRIQFAGASRNYYVSTATGTPCTSITFTPALATADGVPANGAAITVLGHLVEIKVGNGNLTYSISQEMLYDLDRGDLDTVREGDEQPMSVSMDLVWEEIRSISTDTLTPTPEEACRQYGAAAAWVTSASDVCEPYSVDIEIEIDKPCTAEELEIYTFPDFRWETIDHNVDDAMLSMQGRCNVTAPTVVRRTWN